MEGATDQQSLTNIPLKNNTDSLQKERHDRLLLLAISVRSHLDGVCICVCVKSHTSGLCAVSQSLFPPHCFVHRQKKKHTGPAEHRGDQLFITAFNKI